MVSQSKRADIVSNKHLVDICSPIALPTCSQLITMKGYNHTLLLCSFLNELKIIRILITLHEPSVHVVATCAQTTEDMRDGRSLSMDITIPQRTIHCKRRKLSTQHAP